MNRKQKEASWSRLSSGTNGQNRYNELSKNKQSFVDDVINQIASDPNERIEVWVGDAFYRFQEFANDDVNGSADKVIGTGVVGDDLVKHYALECGHCGKFYDSNDYQCGCPDSFDAD
tara:strand:+ start:6422 stop:6772 length:351 start_codon:yes stop_codon:yes gene_type:complete